MEKFRWIALGALGIGVVYTLLLQFDLFVVIFDVIDVPRGSLCQEWVGCLGLIMLVGFLWVVLTPIFFGVIGFFLDNERRWIRALQALVLAFVILSICLAVSVFLLKLKTEKEVALAVQRAKEAEVWGLEEHARRIKEEEERQANDKPLSNPNFVPNQNDNFLGVGQTKIMPVYKKDGMYNISASIGNTAQIKSVFLEKFDGSLHDFPQPLLDTQYNMNDNGTDGDVLSNDGVYTIELNLDPLENGSIR